MKAEKSRDYVDNKKLFAAMVVFIKDFQATKAAGTPKPEIPRYIAECISKICNGLATKANYQSNQSYKDEMVGDAIENCIRYIGGFNPEKSNNPFAWFSQIAANAFLRRIEKEKKEHYVKYLIQRNTASFLSDAEKGEISDIGECQETMMGSDAVNDFIKSFEEYLEKKKTRRSTKKGLEKFVDEEVASDEEATDE